MAVFLFRAELKKKGTRPNVLLAKSKHQELQYTAFYHAYSRSYCNTYLKEWKIKINYTVNYCRAVTKSLRGTSTLSIKVDRVADLDPERIRIH
jgi:hypothetical protein